MILTNSHATYQKAFPGIPKKPLRAAIGRAFFTTYSGHAIATKIGSNMNLCNLDRYDNFRQWAQPHFYVFTKHYVSTFWLAMMPCNAGGGQGNKLPIQSLHSGDCFTKFLMSP